MKSLRDLRHDRKIFFHQAADFCGVETSMIQTGNQEKVECLLLIEGDRATEKKLHTQFNCKWIANEWFMYDDLIAKFIRDNYHLNINLKDSPNV